MTDDRSNPSPREQQPSPNAQNRSDFNSVTVFGPSLAKVASIAGLAVLLVSAVIVYTISRHRSAEQQSAANANPNSSLTALSALNSIAKPSPIRRAQSQPQPWSPPPSAPVHTLPAIAPAAPRVAPAPPAQHDAAATPPAVPPVPAPHSAPSLPSGMRFSANRDGFSNGCRHGLLIIETSSLTFTCPNDRSKSVAVSVRQVRELDDNGIVVFPRQKYHFDIAGKQKQAVHELFAQWLQNARRTPTERASN